MGRSCGFRMQGRLGVWGGGDLYSLRALQAVLFDELKRGVVWKGRSACCVAAARKAYSPFSNKSVQGREPVPLELS